MVQKGLYDVVVVNRTVENARALADRFGGRAHGLDEIPRVLSGTGLAILSTPKGVLSGRQASRDKAEQIRTKPSPKLSQARAVTGRAPSKVHMAHSNAPVSLPGVRPAWRRRSWMDWCWHGLCSIIP